MLIGPAQYLVVNVFAVEGDVDGERGRVVMRSQRRLLVGTVAHHEIHDGLSLHAAQVKKSRKSFICVIQKRFAPIKAYQIFFARQKPHIHLILQITMINLRVWPPPPLTSTLLRAQGARTLGEYPG